MSKTNIFQKLSFILIGFFFVYTPLMAQSDAALEGMKLFQGEQRFENGGPSCLSCHNVNSKNSAMGGKYALDLTDVYGKLGAGIAGWLANPSNEAMQVSFGNNELTENEREKLMAYFKYAYENKDTQTAGMGGMKFLIWGLIGLAILLGIFQLLWGKRKTAMTKQDIFKRSMKAADAKF